MSLMQRFLLIITALIVACGHALALYSGSERTESAEAPSALDRGVHGDRTEPLPVEPLQVRDKERSMRL
jgi:hypothetical protein